MRVISLIVGVIVLLVVDIAGAQEWTEHVSVEDGFSALFPGTPKTESIAWASQMGYPLQGRVYRASRGQDRYSVTVVDYRPLERLGPERSKGCPEGAETCIGTNDGRQGAITGLGYWKTDARGAMTFALQKLLKRAGTTLGGMTLEFMAVVEGYQLRLNNPDTSATLAFVAMHEGRLYIFEATTPQGALGPELFQTSGGFVDARGQAIRYLDYYSHGVHGLRQHDRPAYRAGGALVGTPPSGVNGAPPSAAVP